MKLLKEITSKEAAIISLKGICMGTADVIPGVSGGTMAFILGIYERLLNAVASVNKETLQLLSKLQIRAAIDKIPLNFIIPLVFGIFLAIIIFTKIIPLPLLLKQYPEPVYGLFFGLVLGSIILLFRQHYSHKLQDFAYIIIGTICGYILVSLVPAEIPDSVIYTFFCGFVAISAMLLPGISGSFILLILGKYAIILDAVGNLYFPILLPFMLGCIAGLATFSRILLWLMKHYHQAALMTIIGLLLGSLKAVWPYQERIFAVVRDKEKLIATNPLLPNMEQLISLTGVLIIAGFGIVFMINHLAKGKSKND